MSISMTGKSTGVVFTLNVASIVRILSCVIVCLLGVSATTWFLNYWGVRPNANSVFNVAEEANVPTYFSALQLLTAGILLSVTAVLKQRVRDQFARHWTLLACGFYFMSFDEICRFHEKLAKPIRAMLPERNLGVWYYGWVIPAIIGCAGVGVFFWRFLASLPRRTRVEFIISAVVFLGGAVGMEMVEGMYYEQYGRNAPGFLLSTSIEEGMEMAGILLFIRALLRNLAMSCDRVTVEMSQN